MADAAPPMFDPAEAARTTIGLEDIACPMLAPAEMPVGAGSAADAAGCLDMGLFDVSEDALAEFDAMVNSVGDILGSVETQMDSRCFRAAMAAAGAADAAVDVGKELRELNDMAKSASFVDYDTSPSGTYRTIRTGDWIAATLSKLAYVEKLIRIFVAATETAWKVEWERVGDFKAAAADYWGICKALVGVEKRSYVAVFTNVIKTTAKLVKTRIEPNDRKTAVAARFDYMEILLLGKTYKAAADIVSANLAVARGTKPINRRNVVGFVERHSTQGTPPGGGPAIPFNSKTPRAKLEDYVEGFSALLSGYITPAHAALVHAGEELKRAAPYVRYGNSVSRALLLDPSTPSKVPTTRVGGAVAAYLWENPGKTEADAARHASKSVLGVVNEALVSAIVRSGNKPGSSMPQLPGEGGAAAAWTSSSALWDL